jgi:pyruvate/2-oxoglutarate/acetoin dehydrogenase E1 component
MTAAIRDDNPVLFFEPMSLSHGPRGEVPAGEHLTPIGPARLARAGSDLTIVAIGSMVPVAQRAATALAREGAEAEVIDLRSLRPWDADLVVDSVRRTGRLVTVQEAWVAGGVSAEVLATVAERAHGCLRAPPLRVGTRPVPVPSGLVRRFALPTLDDLLAAARAVLRTMSS